MAVTSEQNVTKVAESHCHRSPKHHHVKIFKVEDTESSLDDTLYSQTKVEHVREFGFYL